MRTVRVKSYAKLNLTLDLLGVNEGYHQLDSLVTTVDLYDLIVLKERKDERVSITMHGMGSEQIPPVKNNAYKAALAFMEKYQTAGVDITVHKNIPMGAGLGGSSADTAGVLNGLAKLYKIADAIGIKELADRLGSDTGYLLSGGFARMQGRGERVERVGACPSLYFLLFLPEGGVSTKECFALSDTMPASPHKTQDCLNALLVGDYARAGACFSNGLYPAAARLNGDVALALQSARSFSPLGASMSGSGSCVFACFDSMELCSWAKSRYRGNFETVIVKAISPDNKTWRNPFALGEED